MSKKSFADEVILEGVSFTVERGEKVGLIGANGSGKTTILKLVMGLEIAEDGAIAKARGLKLGYLPHQAEHRPDSTVKDEQMEEAYRKSAYKKGAQLVDRL